MNSTKHITKKNQHKNSVVTKKHLFFQPKFSIDLQNDVYEREADAMAEKATRLAPNKNSFFKSSTKNIHRKESTINHLTGVTPSVQQTLQSTGQSLDHGTRSFMESRFDHDFSNVQIHNDSLANQSSSDINALAYTHGNHIVFGEGQYQPQTQAGKQLLAHELTHVIQQKQHRMPLVQRQFDFKDPAPLEKDPVPIVYNTDTGSTDKSKTSLGFTTPTFNGKLLSGISEHDLSGFFVMGVSGSIDDAGTPTCSANTSKINASVSAQELIITQPHKSNEWHGTFSSYPGNDCKKKKAIPVTVKDTTGGKNLYDIILKNENEHAADLKTIISNINKFLDSIGKFSVSGKDQKDCIQKLTAKIGKTDNPALGMAREFLKKWKDSKDAWDVPGKHTIKKDPASISKDCSKIEFNLHT